ncbi:MAG TPA: alpha/beta fold hydrolase [Acidimicrobiia bacterium]|nr:alpha/beta fold hydrolase [Acidimicrobiia bacterium]
MAAGGCTVVLVHGAWHGSWCWAALIEQLEGLGFPSATVDLPSIDRGGALGDLHDDAGAVRQAVDAIEGPVVVVAHSYGGAPVTEGLVGAVNVAHLVYVSAFLLDEGESILGAVGGVEPLWWRISADGQTLEPDHPEHVFFADCPPDTVAAAAASLRPQSRAAFTQTLRGAAWRDIPSTYVVCEQDNAIPAFAQEAMAQRAGTVQRLSSGHSPFLSQPDELAKIVRQTVETSAAS